MVHLFQGDMGGWPTPATQLGLPASSCRVRAARTRNSTCRLPARNRGARWCVRHAPYRCGVTLLEVLFSMMIAAIGLLGAIALLPVAIEQANKGRQADAQAIAGEAAVNDFKVRGFHYYDNWIASDASGTFSKPLDFRQGVCFDPLAVSHHWENSGLSSQYRLFPTLGTGPQMIRVGIFDELTPAGRGPFPIPVSVAETCVKSFDELRYDRPQDRSLDAVQRYTQPGNLRREIEPLREFSWFATLAPSILNSDEFILGMVVIYRRQLPDAAPPTTTERVIDNVIFAVDPVIPDPKITRDTGGEITLWSNSAADLELGKGSWIMLKGVDTDGQSHFRWYRVIDTGPTEPDPPAPASPTNYFRNVTLFGADWPSKVRIANTQAVIVEGVKAVYERTIRLQQANFGTTSSSTGGSGGSGGGGRPGGGGVGGG